MAGKIPDKYAPKYLPAMDRMRQLRAIRRSRRAYKKGVYIGRAKLASAKTRKSKFTKRVARTYRIPDRGITLKALAKRAGCSMRAFHRILSKGRGAFYSSGSRPNQTPQSWARARLYSAITGGPASKIDRHIMEEDCAPDSKALSLARQSGGNSTRSRALPPMKEKIVKIMRSKAKGKKYAAEIFSPATGKTRTVNFGGLGYAQYKDRTNLGLYSHLDHGDRARMGRYFLRHSGTRNRRRAIQLERAKSGGIYNPKILSHELLW